MPRGHHAANFVAINIDNLHALFGHRQLRQAEIRHVFHDRFHHARAVRTIDLKLHAGKLCLVFREHAGQDVNARGLIGGDHQFAARSRFQLVERVLRLTPHVHHLFGIVGEQLARGGERNAAAEALKQLAFQLVFQLADLGADRRLRAVTGLRGFRETLQPDDFQESVDLIEIHEGPLLPVARRY